MPAGPRLLAGLAVGSALDGTDAALIATSGSGLNLAPRVLHAARTPFPPDLRQAMLRDDAAAMRSLNDAFCTAARSLAREAGRDPYCIGILAPSGGVFGTVPEAVADASGATVVAHFSARDLAAGGIGGPITPAADHLLFADQTSDRLLIHLGANASIVLLPAGGTMSDLIAFDAGPCMRLLDSLVRSCSRDGEPPDAAGTRAVQGRLSAELLEAWLRQPFITRKPPKMIGRDDFGPAFIQRTIEDARRLRLELNDLLCTAAHFIVQSVRWNVSHHLPHASTQRSIHLSGRGTRHGLLRQLLVQQFPAESLLLTDELGVPALARKAAAAAVLAGLTLDGITGNLPFATGASGGRLIGRIIPGDPPNWAAVAAGIAEQLWDYAQLRAAA